MASASSRRTTATRPDPLPLGRVKLTWQASEKTRVTLSYSTDFNDIVNLDVVGARNRSETWHPEAERRVQRGGHWVGLLTRSSRTSFCFSYRPAFRTKLPGRLAAESRWGRTGRRRATFFRRQMRRRQQLCVPKRQSSVGRAGKWNLQFAPTLYTARGLGGTTTSKPGFQFFVHEVSTTALEFPGGLRYLDSVARVCRAIRKIRARFGSCNQVGDVPESLVSTVSRARLPDKVAGDKRWRVHSRTAHPSGRADDCSGPAHRHRASVRRSGARIQTLFGFGPGCRLSMTFARSRRAHQSSLRTAQRHGQRRHRRLHQSDADIGPEPLEPTTSMFDEVRRSGGRHSQRFATDLNMTPPRSTRCPAGIHRQVLG